MFCNTCGAELVAGNAFCTKCGTPVSSAPDKTVSSIPPVGAEPPIKTTPPAKQPTTGESSWLMTAPDLLSDTEPSPVASAPVSLAEEPAPALFNESASEPAVFKDEPLSSPPLSTDFNSFTKVPDISSDTVSPSETASPTIPLYNDTVPKAPQHTAASAPVTLKERKAVPLMPQQDAWRAPAYTAAPTPKASVTADKESFVTMGFGALLLVAIAAINLLLFFALKFEKGISIASTFNSDVIKNISLSQVLASMYHGSSAYAPTVASKLLAMTVYVLIYSLPVISLIMFVGTAVNKSKSWHISLTVFSILSAAALAAVVPLMLAFASTTLNIISTDVSILRDDMGAVTYLPLILFAAGAVVFTVVSYIPLITFIRRGKK